MLMLKLVANAELKVMLSVAFSLSGTEAPPANPIISSKSETCHNYFGTIRN